MINQNFTIMKNAFCQRKLKILLCLIIAIISNTVAKNFSEVTTFDLPGIQACYGNTAMDWGDFFNDGNIDSKKQNPTWTYADPAIYSVSFIMGDGTNEDIETKENLIHIIDNSFTWCDIPAGDYTYGQNDEIRNIAFDFKIMKYEVTNQQYEAYLEDALSAEEITVSGSTVVGYYGGDTQWSAGTYEYYDLDSGNNRIHWNGSSFTIDNGYESHPVNEVTWFGANAFAEFYGFLLPTEDEWEKAARGNTGYDYPWGDNIEGSRANYFNSGDPFDNQTTPFGYYTDLKVNHWRSVQIINLAS